MNKDTQKWAFGVLRSDNLGQKNVVHEKYRGIKLEFRRIMPIFTS